MYYCRKDGLDIPVLFSASVVKDKDGSISYIICTASDITAHKRAEEKEKEAIEMKAKLTSMVSYDMRARMTAVNTAIYLLLSGKGEAVTHKQKGLLELIQRNAGKLLHLINNFLDFSKLQASRIEFVIEENDINELIQEIYQEMKPLVEGKGLVFTLELSESLPRIQFDRDRIAQVLINLVSNAVDYTEKGRITITTQQDREGIRVAVSDTGMGINTDDMQRIFVSFEQIQYPGEEGLRGTALGLAICKEIIQKHKGRIWVESEVKKGSVFYFTLPC
jgi:signal transduction histidine kinase